MISVASEIKTLPLCLCLVFASFVCIAQDMEPDAGSDTTQVFQNLMKTKQKSKVDSLPVVLKDTTLNLISAVSSAKDSLPGDSVKVKVNKGTKLESEIKYHARDSIRFSVEEKKVYLYGEAQINYEDIELKAAYIEIDQETKEVYAEGVVDSTGKLIGNPEFKTGEQNFSAKRMRYNFETEKGRILDVVTKEGEGNLRGETVKKTEEGHYYIQDGGYTTCDSEEPHYMIKAKKLKVIPNDKIVSGPAFLMFEGVYTPLVIPFLRTK